MTSTNKHFRLGDLLLEAEILTSEFIKEALSIYESQGLPLGKVLVITGYLNDTTLKAALDLQYMVNDQLLEFEKAVEVMKVCHTENRSVSEAFVRAKIIRPEDNETNKLGQLLINAEIIDEEALDQCLQTNETTSLPLGHIICHRGLVSQPLINRTLAVQNLIRTGHIDRKTGIDSLIFAQQRELRLQALNSNKGYVKMPLKATPRLGELYAQCNILTDAQISEILIDSIVKKTTFGVALSKKSRITESLVESTVEIQEMIDRETVEKEQALAALTNVLTREINAIKAVAEANTFKLMPNQAVALIDLLKSCGIISNEQISREMQECLSVNYNQVRQVVALLQANKTVDDTILFSALRLVDLINRKHVSYEKAIVALECSQRAQKDIEYTLYMTGVFDRTRLRENQFEEAAQVE